jgi:recombination associated protein RdgC
MSWFKNATIYRLGAAAKSWTAAGLSEQLATRTFAPCGSLEMSSISWVPPVDGEGLAFAVANQNIILALCTERKVLPAQVINRITRERCAALATQQGFEPGRKQRREVKEQVVDDLLPQAFAGRAITRVWLDLRNGWLVVDSPSPARCDDAIKALIQCIDKLPVDSLVVKQSPASAMTQWLTALAYHDDDDLPASFSVDQDAELQAQGDGRATVRYIHHTLEHEGVGRHIAEGKQCTRLAMTWDDRISFVLTDTLTLKNIAPLDILKEDSSDDAFLMACELNGLLRDLVAALGGESK